jgi:mannose-6-phosphate isomerase-like protein (cupin superfamily)
VAVVLISMATSSGDDMPQNIESLYSRNRLNVAISRARCLSVIFASARLLEIPCKIIEQRFALPQHAIDDAQAYFVVQQVGISEAPHGGFGFLHFRNVLSNYFVFRDSQELSRDVEPWMLDANGQNNPAPHRENFMAVDYMDLHVLKPECGIGIHRHRDNSEIFFLLSGTGIMVMGDWCGFPDRERSFEIRTMTAGSFSLLKPGNLHALFNVTDEDISLLMFGGYD